MGTIEPEVAEQEVVSHPAAVSPEQGTGSLTLQKDVIQPNILDELNSLKSEVKRKLSDIEDKTKKIDSRSESVMAIVLTGFIVVVLMALSLLIQVWSFIYGSIYK